MAVREYYGSAEPGEALAKYRRDGYALFPKLFSDAEVDDILARIALCRDDDRLKRNQRGDQLNIVFWSARVDPVLDELRSSERLFPIVEAVLGTADVKQHIQHIYFRDLGNRDSFRWHRDEIFRGEGLADPRRSYVALAIYLDDVTSVDQGAVLYVPGSHKWGEVEGLESVASIESRAGGKWDVEEHFPDCEAMLPRRGMVGIWNPGTIHGSGPNMTMRNRRNLLHGYARADAVEDPSYIWTWKEGEPLPYAEGAAVAA